MEHRMKLERRTQQWVSGVSATWRIGGGGTGGVEKKLWIIEKGTGNVFLVHMEGG